MKKSVGQYELNLNENNTKIMIINRANIIPLNERTLAGYETVENF